MRLVEYEILIKEKVKNNRNNPEIYNDLQKMILMFLKRKRVCDNPKDYEDMSYSLAGDIYMKILEGETISYYLGYLEKIYRKYAHQYYQENRTDYICFDDSDNYQELIYGKKYSYEYDMVGSQVYLEEIWKVVDQVMYQSCKYEDDTPEFINLKLSLVLSLLRGEETYFHLNIEQKFYLKLLIVSFYHQVKEEVKNE